MSAPPIPDREIIPVSIETVTVGIASCEGCSFHWDALDLAMVAPMQADSMMHAISTGHVVNEFISRSLTVRPG